MSQKRADLIRTAEHLFYQNGFHAIGIKRIVTESGIATMTLYNHFASKEELIIEVLQQRESRYLDHLHRHLGGAGETGSMLKKLCHAHGLWLQRHEQRGCLFLRAKEEYNGDAEHPIVQLVDKHKHTLQEWIHNLHADITFNQALQATLLMEGATALAETSGAGQASEQLEMIAEQMFA
ncbi:TetR/AcrR family transcriptional regulator [Paenibacillus daejeonensis]|uniref:TetR/AcrR family transcriptional regulator n=1 Tax=Paenibacillus daejeonensis TaxID=135193 RepID=UPI000364E9AD|nr:TetR/AcrR family transcriptional regulator [Paenibacillus daejeonensis]